MNFIRSEIKETLLKEYKYRIEMHAHTTPESTCSQITPEDMAKIYHELNYDAIVITNHFIYNYNLYEKYSPEDALEKYVQGYEKTKKAAEQYGLIVILGAELRFTESLNDYLIYGIDKPMLGKIYDMLPNGLEAFRKNFNMEQSVLFHAHPFRDGMNEVSPELLDGIETFNMHPGQNSRVAKAVKYASEKNFKLTLAGTDYHNYGSEGMAAIRTKILPKNSFELANILKSEDYLLEIGGNAIILP